MSELKQVITDQLDRIAVSGNEDMELLNTSNSVERARYIELVKLRKEALLAESRINMSLTRLLYRSLVQR